MRLVRAFGQAALAACLISGCLVGCGGAVAASAEKGKTAFVRTTNRAMPPYSEAILSNDDLADIHSYLQTISKPADYKSIPLLNQ